MCFTFQTFNSTFYLLFIKLNKQYYCKLLFSKSVGACIRGMAAGEGGHRGIGPLYIELYSYTYTIVYLVNVYMRY